MDSVFRQKRSLRAELRSQRREAAAANPEAAHVLRDIFLDTISLPKSCLVGAYIAQGSEMNPAPLVKALQDQGYAIALPFIMENSGDLHFRAYQKGDALEAGGPFEIPQPRTEAALVVPDVFFVPLLGFDAKGNRLGQGRGYYDHYFEIMRSKKMLIAIGLAYDAQKRDFIPHTEHDQPLDAIVTETRVIDPFVARQA